MVTLSLDFLNATTRTKFIPVLKDQIYDRRVVFNRLNAKGRKKSMTATALEWQVVMKRHAAFGIYTGYDKLINQPINPLVKATLPPAEYYATLAISKTEERRNSGNPEKLLDMVKVQHDNALETMQEGVGGTDIYGSGTLIAGRQPVIGLAAAINSGNTYADIDRTDTANAAWQANYDATAYTLAHLKDSTDPYYFPHLLRYMHKLCTHRNSPDLVVLGKDNYTLYEDISEGRLRIDNEVADLGFGGAKLSPGVTMTFDDYCTAGGVFFLTLQDWTLYVYDGADFDMQEEGWIVPPDQAAKVTHIFWSGQLRLDTPREQGRFTNVGQS
jgi:hypothetical protein